MSYTNELAGAEQPMPLPNAQSAAFFFKERNAQPICVSGGGFPISALSEFDLGSSKVSDTATKTSYMKKESVNNGTVTKESPASFLTVGNKFRKMVYDQLFLPCILVVVSTAAWKTFGSAGCTSILYVNRQLSKEAIPVRYGRTQISVQHPHGIGLLTGLIGVDNLKHIRTLSLQLEFLPNVTETIKQLFPDLRDLVLWPSPNFNKSWAEFLKVRHAGHMVEAVKNSLTLSPQLGSTVGLREVLAFSEHYHITVQLLDWHIDLGQWQVSWLQIPHSLILENGLWRLYLKRS